MLGTSEMNHWEIGGPGVTPLSRSLLVSHYKSSTGRQFAC